MTEFVKFKNIVDKKDLFIYLTFLGENINELNPNDIYPRVEKALDLIDKNIEYNDLLKMVRDLFSKFNEIDLVLSLNKRNVEYSSHYINGDLTELLINKQIGRDTEITYNYCEGVFNYNINTTASNTNEELFNFFMEEVPQKVKRAKN